MKRETAIYSLELSDTSRFMVEQKSGGGAFGQRGDDWKAVRAFNTEQLAKEFVAKFPDKRFRIRSLKR